MKAFIKFIDKFNLDNENLLIEYIYKIFKNPIIKSEIINNNDLRILFKKYQLDISKPYKIIKSKNFNDLDIEIWKLEDKFMLLGIIPNYSKNFTTSNFFTIAENE